MNKDPKRYYLELYVDTWEIPEKVIVGRFKHYDYDYFEIKVVLDSEEINIAKQRELVTAQFRHKGIMMSEIYMNKKFLKKLLKSNAYFSLLYHELGHVHFEHYKRTFDRNSFIETGKVSPLELEADSFSLYHFEVYQLINTLKKQRNERKKINDSKSKWAIKEYDLRIKELKKLM